MIIMKHIYYGIKRQTVPYIDKCRLHALDRDLSSHYELYHRSFYRAEIISSVKSLKENRDTIYVWKQYANISNEVFITEKQHEHICEIGDKVKIGRHEGKITDRKYNAENDIMYYYTDIIVADMDSEETDKQLKIARKAVLEELRRLFKKHFSEEEKPLPRGEIPNKKKSFWERIFG
jgi:hemerythrin